MLYFGDRARDVDPRQAIGAVVSRMRRAGRETGSAREASLVSALIEAGELAQGLADGAFEGRGCDDDDLVSGAALELALAVARTARGGDATACFAAADRLAAIELPARVRVNVPEGYAHYAVYPVCYAKAAGALHGRVPFVVGIRSIGTSLAAAVAAASGAREVATVRPVGHPYHRRLVVGPRLAQRIVRAGEAGARFAVVDEGPGMSGSSFGAVLAWLRGAGVPPDRTVLLPAHAGALGPASSLETRALWRGAAKQVATFEEEVLPRLKAVLRDRFGAGELTDVAGGRWRSHGSIAERHWPPVFAQHERRKYLGRAGDDLVLARFAGLGRYGEAALARARALASEGFGPPVLGLEEGFLVQRWVERGRSCAAPRSVAGAARRHLARYLRFRASTFPAPCEEGASCERLLEMVRVNALEALGAEDVSSIEMLERGARDAERLPRVVVDGKLEWWEWIAADDRLIKADGTDHAAGHDLVGCQPVAWDVAGASVELGLGWGEALDLARALVPDTTADALAFMEAAYLAHRLGRWTFAAAVESDAVERHRIRAAVERYRELLRRRLARAP